MLKRKVVFAINHTRRVDCKCVTISEARSKIVVSHFHPISPLRATWLCTTVSSSSLSYLFCIRFCNTSFASSSDVNAPRSEISCSAPFLFKNCPDSHINLPRILLMINSSLNGYAWPSLCKWMYLQQALFLILPRKRTINDVCIILVLFDHLF